MSNISSVTLYPEDDLRDTGHNLASGKRRLVAVSTDIHIFLSADQMRQWAEVLTKAADKMEEES